MERNRKKILIGTVVSANAEKTISVLVESAKKHPLYGKPVKQSKKFAAHDENNQAKVGDVVKIVESRPLSKTKKFRLLEIVESKVLV